MILYVADFRCFVHSDGRFWAQHIAGKWWLRAYSKRWRAVKQLAMRKIVHRWQRPPQPCAMCGQ
jgi:hypothetical protein